MFSAGPFEHNAPTDPLVEEATKTSRRDSEVPLRSAVIIMVGALALCVCVSASRCGFHFFLASSFGTYGTTRRHAVLNPYCRLAVGPVIVLYTLLETTFHMPPYGLQKKVVTDYCYDLISSNDPICYL